MHLETLSLPSRVFLLPTEAMWRCVLQASQASAFLCHGRPGGCRGVPPGVPLSLGTHMCRWYNCNDLHTVAQRYDKRQVREVSTLQTLQARLYASRAVIPMYLWYYFSLADPYSSF